MPNIHEGESEISPLVRALRTLRKFVDKRDRQPDKGEITIQPPETGAERAEEKEFEESKKRDAVPERYRTKIDKY